MATVINNPDNQSTGGAGLIIGVIIFIVVIGLLLVYGLPAIRNSNRGTTVNVPDKVQVDVNGTDNSSSTNP